MDDERWPMLPAILAGLGLTAGLAAHVILGDASSDVGAARLALLTLVLTAAILFGLVVERTSVRTSAGFALGWGAIAALIAYWNGPLSHWGDVEGWRFVSLVLAIGVAAPLFQGARDSAFRALPYARVYDHGWANLLLWGAACAFTGIVFLLAWLLAALFQLIGLRFLGELLEKSWFWRPLMGLAFGGGLALLREHRGIVALLRQVAMLVLGVLAPVLAAGLALFLAALPFTGLAPLWEATKATTPILLSCVVGGLVLVNAVIGSGDEEERRNRVLRAAALLLGLAMLPLALIAAIAMGLRIDQHGFTPERLWALTFVVLACAYALAYLVSIARGRAKWAALVRPTNLRLAVGTCIVALILATPLLNFNVISTRDQMARLQSGRIAPDRFDWAALAFDFGESGKRAVAALARSPDPRVRQAAVAALAKKNRWEVAQYTAQAQALAQLDKQVRVLPRPTPLPTDLRALLAAQSQCGPDNSGGCTLMFQPGGSEALLLTAACFAPPSGGTLVLHNGCVTRLVRDTRGWRVVEPFTPPQLSAAESTAVASAYTRGGVEVGQVTRRQLFVGGVPAGTPFE